MIAWKETLLEDLADEITVGFVGSMTDEYIDSGIPFLRSKNVEPFIINWDDIRYISREFHQKIKKSALSPGDVVIVRTGKPGAASIIPDSLIEANCSDLVIIRPNSKIDRRFLVYYLNSIAVKHINSYLVGAVQQHFNIGAARQLKIKLPPLVQEQKAIADVLSCLDAKIENLRSQNQTLEKIAQTLFNHWFVDFEFPNNSGEPYKSSGGAMVASELGNIPVGWRVGVFGDLIEIIIDNRGKTPPIAQEGILMMEGNQLFCDKSFPDYSALSKQKFVSLKTYDIWFRSGHPKYLDVLCATVGTLPKWGFMPKNKKICIAQNIIALRANKNICNPYWLRLFMNTRYFIKSMLGRLLTTAQPSIKVGHMMSIGAIIPESRLVDNFSEIIEPLFLLIEVNSQQIQTLTKTRDILLPKLMSGQIRVAE